VKTTIWDK
jgi:transcription antitermination factor NusG